MEANEEYIVDTMTKKIHKPQAHCPTRLYSSVNIPYEL